MPPTQSTTNKPVTFTTNTNKVYLITDNECKTITLGEPQSMTNSYSFTWDTDDDNAYPYEFDEYDDWGSYNAINQERYPDDSNNQDIFTALMAAADKRGK